MNGGESFERQVIERLARIEERLKCVPQDLRELRARIEAMERWRARLVGIGAAVGAVVTLIGTRLVNALWPGAS